MELVVRELFPEPLDEVQRQQGNPESPDCQAWYRYDVHDHHVLSLVADFFQVIEESHSALDRRAVDRLGQVLHDCRVEQGPDDGDSRDR